MTTNLKNTVMMFFVDSKLVVEVHAEDNHTSRVLQQNATKVNVSTVVCAVFIFNTDP